MYNIEFYLRNYFCLLNKNVWWVKLRFVGFVEKERFLTFYTWKRGEFMGGR